MDVGLVCDGCATFNAMGASECTRCGNGLSLDASIGGSTPASNPSAASAPRKPATAQISAAGRNCPQCLSPVIPGHMFCGACGTRMDDAPSDSSQPAVAAPAPPSAPEPKPKRSGGAKKTMFFSAMQAARAKLVVIKGDGLDGVSFTLAGDEHLAGRVDTPLLFDEDPFLSPVHANFFYNSGQLAVRDEGSVNGIYIRISGQTPIAFGDRFLVGEQLIEVQEVPSAEVSPAPDGTYFFASPRRASQVRLLQMLRGGDTGLAYRTQAASVSLGREDNDINFPDDPFISGHHAQVGLTEGQLSLTDLDSKNGTFLRIREEHLLSHGDYVFMGQQLLRVEIV